MTRRIPHEIMDNLIKLGNEIIALTKKAYIFRSICAYNAQHVYSYISALKQAKFNAQDNKQIQALNEVRALFTHLITVLPLLGEDKWIQPALNWPTQYLQNYIKKFRERMIELAPVIGLPTDVISFDTDQDKVNLIADYTALKKDMQGLITKIDFSDVVGVQQQIETKLSEIKSILPHESRRNNTRRPSADAFPLVQMQKKVSELLSQFKSINIENSDISLGRQIGSGGFGTVYKATRLSTSEIVAVKELRSDRLTMSSWASLYAEVENMASISHPFVLELVGAHITEPYRIITRYCPGKSLFDRLHRCSHTNKLSPTKLTTIAYQVAVGMEHLHANHIVHRDLKTQNILLDEYDDGCVADFGLSGMMKDNQELCGGLGTPHYTAPEVFLKGTYGPKIDVFSYACVLWELLMKKVPYYDMSQNEIYEHVVTRGWRLPIPNETPEGLKKIITKCWSKNPNDRPDFKEIVKRFENGEIYFPGSDKIDFLKIKSTRRCPPIDFDFATATMKNPKAPNFSSVIYFICSKIDRKMKHKLKQEKLLDQLVHATENMDAVLLLASTLLGPKDYHEFLENGGFEMFRVCVSENKGQSLPSSLKFAIKVPIGELNRFQEFIPKIISYLDGGSELVNSLALRFFNRFSSDVLIPYKKEIAGALLDAAESVSDQDTFDAIVSLLPICSDCLTPIQIRSFHYLLGCDFIVPPFFVISLMQTNDKKSHASLILAILKATAKSDVTSVFLDFLQKLYKEEREVFEEVSEIDGFLKTVYDIMEQGSLQAPLFLLYCVAPFDEAAIDLSKDKLLLKLIQMKEYPLQRLQILTALCMHESFCATTVYMDGIINFMVKSLSDKKLVNDAARLIGSLSSHEKGCQILTNNGVLEVFTQLYLSSSSGDTATSQLILRNVARNRCEIPQGSLIVSCLMQDMIYDVTRRAQILDTLIPIVEEMPSSIQEHDLQLIVLQQLTMDDPLLVQLALKLIAACEPSSLRNIYQQILGAVYDLLKKKEMGYPEIVEGCLEVLITLAKGFDIKEFVKQTNLQAYVQKVIELLPQAGLESHTVSLNYLLSTLIGK